MEKVVIIGGGIIGCFLAHDLSQYEVEVTLIERKHAVCDEVTAANSAIVHAGYDPKEGTLKALLNRKGALMYPSICEHFHADYQRCGALVVACGEKEEETLEHLLAQGRKRGVEMIPLTREEIKAREPHISDAVTKALSVPETAIITPWALGNALIQEGVLNGVNLQLAQSVQAIEKTKKGYLVHTNQNSYEADIIINAAGLGSGAIMEMLEETPLFEIKPKRGQYYVLSKQAKSFVHEVIYPVPGPAGKGILCVPTVHGNTLLGPNSEWLDHEDTATTAQGLQEVREKLQKTMKEIPFGEVIHSYSGLRPCGNADDFYIQASAKDAHVIHLGCIDSPGLASAPAISTYVIDTLIKPISELKEKSAYQSWKEPLRMSELSEEERNEVIAKQPGYGHIICRCEQISEAEVIACIHEPCGAKTIKEIKKRVRPGMGKCQGGFCEVEIAKLLAQELHIPLSQVSYDRTAYFKESKVDTDENM